MAFVANTGAAIGPSHIGDAHQRRFLIVAALQQVGPDGTVRPVRSTAQHLARLIIGVTVRAVDVIAECWTSRAIQVQHIPPQAGHLGAVSHAGVGNIVAGNRGGELEPQVVGGRGPAGWSPALP